MGTNDSWMGTNDAVDGGQMTHGWVQMTQWMGANDSWVGTNDAVDG